MNRPLAVLALSIALAAIGLPVHAVTMTFTGNLTGTQEVPPNASPGTGSVVVTMDTDAHTMTLGVTFQDLLAPTTIAHIHCCAAPTASPATTVPSFPTFPVGVTSGTWNEVIDMSLAGSFNPAFITANGGTPASAEVAFFNGLNAGLGYFNIHTGQFPGGEIRANLAPIPEPSTYALLGVGLAVVGFVARRRRG